LGTFLVDPAGRNVLKDPKITRAMIIPQRDIELIRIVVGQLKRPLSCSFSGDAFAQELMPFFQ
jgi:hypothetical protein